MKKKKLKNLGLNKSVVSRLNPESASQIRGGGNTRLACDELTNCSCASCPGPSQSVKLPCITVCNNIA